MKNFSMNSSAIAVSFLLVASVVYAENDRVGNERFVQVNYNVPISADQPELAPFSVFKSGMIQLRSDELGLHVSYDLPRALTGNLISIEMQGTQTSPGEFVFRGKHGAMTCLQLRCSIRFLDLNIDPTVVEEFLRTNVSSSAELTSRLRVARHFDADPGGILHLAEPIQ